MLEKGLREKVNERGKKLILREKRARSLWVLSIAIVVMFFSLVPGQG